MWVNIVVHTYLWWVVSLVFFRLSRTLQRLTRMRQGPPLWKFLKCFVGFFSGTTQRCGWKFATKMTWKRKCIHPGRLTWNLQITHLERKMIFQTSMIMVHVNLPGCKFTVPTWVISLVFVVRHIRCICCKSQGQIHLHFERMPLLGDGCFGCLSGDRCGGDVVKKSGDSRGIKFWEKNMEIQGDSNFHVLNFAKRTSNFRSAQNSHNFPGW